MPEKRICIVAKTYPQPSRKYDELVCTAGITSDGEWIRLYPVPFRKLVLEQQYRKFHWIECDVERRDSDFRPESQKEEWMVRIQEQCKGAEVPFFFKARGGTNKQKMGSKLQAKSYKETPRLKVA